MGEIYYQRAMELKALSDPNRLVILDQLKDGERCACNILELLKISQPTLSHHMRVLCETGLVNCRREGKWMHYRLNSDKFKELSVLLDGFTGGNQKINRDKC
jgi:ArsR family transcriptional regulator